jgi:hypothetical protein
MPPYQTSRITYLPACSVTLDPEACERPLQGCGKALLVDLLVIEAVLRLAHGGGRL